MHSKPRGLGVLRLATQSNTVIGYQFDPTAGFQYKYVEGTLKTMSKRFASGFAVLVCAIAWSGVVGAQSKAESPAKDETGFTSYVELGGTTNSAGQVYEIDSSAGYTFTPHFGMDFGLPIYFVSGSSSTTGSSSGSGVGNPSVDLRWKCPHTSLSYATVLTGSAPLGDKSLGL